MKKMNKTLSRAAEGIGPAKPGNLTVFYSKGAKSYRCILRDEGDCMLTSSTNEEVFL